MMKRFFFNFQIALESFSYNRLRSFLTSLGIVFGTASVITMLAIGKGAEQEILEQMQLLGAQNVIIKPIVKQDEGDVEKKTNSAKEEKKRFSPGLTLLDAKAIASAIPNVSRVSVETVIETSAMRNALQRTIKLIGVDSAYSGVAGMPVVEGNNFTEEQLRLSASVCLIGHGIKSRFFPNEDPVGKTIKCGPVWLTVVGVLKERFVSAQTLQRLGIRNVNMDVYTPITTMLLRYRNRAMVTQEEIRLASQEGEDDGNKNKELTEEAKNYHQLDRIVVQMSSSAFSTSAADVLSRMLKRRHNDVVDVEITVPELLLQQEKRTKSIFNIVLGAIASISLVVGGIGIMNIMLASVMERIREIGVRLALGATPRDITMQFLSESVTISVLGGIAGVILGVIGSFVIERLTDITTIISLWSAVLSFAVSLAVGLIFGFIPARKAAQQDPVVSLRYE
ncbi:MAG: ABC transporter permease [Candidatus Kapabacteria bacterium]|jgi:putative ABC transport system permease protein|nr:ABC transporter permease [Candidatus Kapabacteria bacterium]